MLKNLLRFLLVLMGLCVGLPGIGVGVLSLNQWFHAYQSVDCPRLVNDPITTLPLDSTERTVREWAEATFTRTERWDHQQWSSGETVVFWHGDGNEHRAFFDGTGEVLQYIQRDYWQGEELSGHQVLTCFGEPEFYQAYYAPEPHHTALIVELIYPKQGLILMSYDLSGILGTPNANERISFREIRYFAPNQTLEAIAPILTGHPRTDEWENREEWLTSHVHSWQGWAQVQIIDY